MAARAVFVCFALLLAGSEASGSRLASDLASMSSDKELKERPIMRVIGLLKDMEAELTKEQESDEEMYDKLVCWCETNDKQKTKAIADAKQTIVDLSAKIEENTALASTREVELGALAKDVEKLTKALGDAEALRAKELAEFNEQEKDLIQSIGSLKGAVNTLAKQNPSALLQQKALVQAAQVLKKKGAMAVAAVTPHQRSEVRRLVQAAKKNDMSLLQLVQGQKNAGQKSAHSGKAPEYAPASGAIFGILKQMKETFETNMENGKKEEAQAVADYASLKSTKEAELAAAKDKIFQYEEELAKAKETTARSKEDRDTTTATLDADTKFLADLKVKCAQIDNEWELRQKARAEELAAVGDTIAILTDDDARDQMSAAGTFMQLRAQSKRQTVAREKTAAALAESGKALNSPRLSYLAIRVRNDAFAKVKESIQGMEVQLGEEQVEEVSKKDGCVSDFNTNDKQTVERNTHKDDVEVEIGDLKAEIQAKTDEETAIKQDIADTQTELKKASENREEENKVFQTTVSDQRATQAILKKALDRMSEVYAKKAGSSAALIQQQAAELRRQMPPGGGFAPLKKNSGGTGIIALLESVIDESKETEEDALSAENDAQAAYEDFVKNSNKSIEAMLSQIVADDEIIGKDTKKEVDDEGDKRQTIGDLLKLGEMAGTLHEACDFTVNNFSERQKSRGDEIEALKQAEAIFSGAH